MNPIKVVKKVKNHVWRNRGKYGLAVGASLMILIYARELKALDSALTDFMSQNNMLDAWEEYVWENV